MMNEQTPHKFNSNQFYHSSGFYSLADRTIEAIREVMMEAVRSGSHPLGSWVKEGDEHHIRHAKAYLYGEYGVFTDEDLHHALCRLAMAVYCRKQGVIGDFGPDGRNKPGV